MSTLICGRIVTFDPARPRAEAVLIADGRIAAVGDRSLAAAHPDAAVVDVGDRTVVPGLIDAHHHLSLQALHPACADLSTARTHEEVVAVLRAHAAAHPEVAWVRGVGWDDLRSGLTLDRYVLDAAELDRPVLVTHFSYHQGVVCSRGLAALGITRATPDPPGGTIVRDTSGTPTGLLQERAYSLAHAAAVGAQTRDPERYAARIAAAGRSLWPLGITAVHDAACAPEAETAYRLLHQRGELPVSVLMLPHPTGLLSRLEAACLDGPPTGEGDDWLRVGPVKLFADGGVAFALDVHVDGQRVTAGTLLPGLTEDAVAAARRGWSVAVHAMGNAGVQAALDALRAAAAAHPEGRWRIEHAALLGTQQLGDAAAIGVIAVVQPGFVELMGDLVGGLRPDDARWLPFRDLRDRGLVLAGSSDAPCGPAGPAAIRYGVTRRTDAGTELGPDQALSWREWWEAHTVGAALAGGQEHERGRIRPGSRADLVVLDGDLDGEDPPVVVETWVAGRRVWSRR